MSVGEEVTRDLWIRRLVGVVAFFLPALMAVVGVRLDQSSLRQDPKYVTAVPVMLLSPVILAALVPAYLIMTSTLPLARRIGLTAAVWCLLTLECGLTVYIVLMAGLR